MKPKGVKKAYSTAGPVTTKPVGKRRIGSKKDISPKELRRLELEKKAVKLRLKGLTYAEIAIELGYTEMGIYKVIVTALENSRKEFKEDIEMVRQMELQRMDTLYLAATEPLTAEPVVVPHPLTGVNQTIAPDKNEAVKTALKVMDRRARLLGLDSKTNFEGLTELPARVYLGVDVNKV